MKILHLSNFGLPDWRLEKAGKTGQNNGHDVVFGGRPSPDYKGKTFSRIYEINWNARARWGLPYYWQSVKKQMKSVIENVRPDIIHAHNIFSAKMVSEFDIPFVYDDYEYWGSYAKVIAEVKTTKSSNNLLRKKIRQFLKNRSITLWPKWEKEITTCHPTITVSDKIAQDLQKISGNRQIFVVPNFPMKFEIDDLPVPVKHDHISCVYQGRDGHNIDLYPHRDMNGFIDFFKSKNVCTLNFIGWNDEDSKNIKYVGLLSRNEMFIEMTKHSIGLIPWKKHWSHYYLNPNKYSEYAHAGLFVMCTSSMETISSTLNDNCILFDDYEDLISKLQYLKENTDKLYQKRLKIYDFARRNLLWENHEKNILEAYKLC